MLHYRKSHLRKVYDEDEIRETRRAGSPRTLTKSGTTWTAFTSSEGASEMPGSRPAKDAEEDQPRRGWADQPRGGGRTRSGWGDLTSDANDHADEADESVKEDYEKTCRTNRILTAHRQTLERVTKKVRDRLSQLREDFSRPEDELFLAELETMRPNTAPAGETSQTTARQGMWSPRKVDETGRLCFIPKTPAQVTAMDLYKMIPKSLVKRRRTRRSERGPGLGSVSGWGALGLTDTFRHTKSEISKIAKENLNLEGAVDALEREKMRLMRDIQVEKEMIAATCEEPLVPEDIAANWAGWERGPSPKTRSGWGDADGPKLKR